MTLSAHDRPLRIEAATLTVRDLARVKAFYVEALGLTEHSADAGSVRLGAPDAPFLTLRADPAAAPASKVRPGLFHIAYLLPERSDLGAWLRHARETGVRLLGASDHGVSEALYLDDPEGNGVELYRDRPDEAWPRDEDGGIAMTTEPLDLQDLAAEAGAPWRGAPAGGRIGHVHLTVGDLDEAAARHQERLGLALEAAAPGAAFLGAGGYHHHLAVNVWRSRGAEPQDGPRTGLSALTLSATPAQWASIAQAAGFEAAKDDQEIAFEDPSAGQIRVFLRAGSAS